MGNRDAMNKRKDSDLELQLEDLLARDEELPEGLYERALAIPDRDRRQRSRRRTFAGIGVAAAAAAVLVLTFSRAGDRHPERPRPPEPTPVAAAPGPAEESLGMLHQTARGRDVPAARGAIRRLGELGRRESLPVLREMLARDECRDVAMVALGSLGDPRAIPAVAVYLPDPYAFAAITRIGGDEAVDALQQRLAHAEVDEGTLLLDGIAQLSGARAARAVVAAVDDPRHGSAAWSVLRANEERLLPSLLARLGSDPDPVLPVLERLAPPIAVEALIELLASRAHRSTAARILARIDTAAAHDALIADHRTADVRDAFRAAGPRMELRLLREVESASRQERIERIELLGLCGGTRAVTAMEALARDPALAPGVVTALGRIGGDEAALALGRLSARTALRRPAIEALGWTHSTAAVDVLVDLANEERTLLTPVLSALARHASPEAVTAIARLDERGTRAERTLRGMDRELVVPALLSLLNDDAPAARRALRAVGQAVPGSAPRTTRLR